MNNNFNNDTFFNFAYLSIKSNNELKWMIKNNDEETLRFILNNETQFKAMKKLGCSLYHKKWFLDVEEKFNIINDISNEEDKKKKIKEIFINFLKNDLKSPIFKIYNRENISVFENVCYLIFQLTGLIFYEFISFRELLEIDKDFKNLIIKGNKILDNIVEYNIGRFIPLALLYALVSPKKELEEWKNFPSEILKLSNGINNVFSILYEKGIINLKPEEYRKEFEWDINDEYKTIHVLVANPYCKKFYPTNKKTLSIKNNNNETTFEIMLKAREKNWNEENIKKIKNEYKFILYEEHEDGELFLEKLIRLIRKNDIFYNVELFKFLTTDDTEFLKEHPKLLLTQIDLHWLPKDIDLLFFKNPLNNEYTIQTILKKFSSDSGKIFHTDSLIGFLLKNISTLEKKYKNKLMTLKVSKKNEEIPIAFIIYDNIKDRYTLTDIELLQCYNEKTGITLIGYLLEESSFPIRINKEYLKPKYFYLKLNIQTNEKLIHQLYIHNLITIIDKKELNDIFKNNENEKFNKKKLLYNMSKDDYHYDISYFLPYYKDGKLIYPNSSKNISFTFFTSKNFKKIFFNNLKDGKIIFYEENYKKEKNKKRYKKFFTL